jgi:hypothetical protein
VIKKVLLSILIIYQCNTAQSESEHVINYNKLALLGGASVGAFIYAYGIQNNMWWKGKKSGFHTNWTEDWNTSLGADKIGHFFFGQTVATIYKHGLKWSGFPEGRSALYAGLFTFSYQTFLEIRDGFSNDYGFSWGDFGANLFGSMYPYMQYHFPSLNNFNLKISFQASERFKNNSNQYILDDYESTYHWLSIDINYFLPEPAGEIFPDIFNLGIGHSVKGLDNNGRAKHEIFIGLDLDLKAVPGESGFLKFLKETLNLYHLPSPVIKIYPNVVWYGLKL